MQKRRIKLFSKAEKVYKQCSPGICPCWSSSPMTLVSSLIGSFQNRYRELLRVSRQWRNLQALKRFGFGHGQSCDPGPGDLALFCPACPQPGINLPEGWENNSNEEILLGLPMQSMFLHVWFFYRWLLGEHWWQMGTSQQII